jgi:GPH family glycoside/pentoside/hexuronide:cation symporter
VFGLAPAAVSTLFVVSRLWNSLNDPIMGAIADRTKSRHGRFRPWILWGAVPLAVLGVLTYTTPDWDDRSKLIYAYVTYNLLMMCYTAVNIPYSALMGVLTSNPQERTQLASFRFVGAFAGGFIINATLLGVVHSFGKEDEASGWQMAMALFGVLAVGMYMVTFAMTKERVQPPKAQNSSFRQDVNDLATNKPWLIMLPIALTFLVGFSIRNGTTLYYFKYFAEEGAVLSLFGNTLVTGIGGITSVFLTLGSLGSLLGCLVTPLLTRRLEKRKAYILCGVVAALATCTMFIVPANALWTVIALQVLISFLMGPMTPIIWSIYTDCADYSEWKTGRRATGLVMSASMFAQGLGWTIAGWTVGNLLAYFGYEANVEQTAESLNGILLMMSVIPAGLLLAGTLLMLFYPLSASKLATIEADLTQRRRQRADEPDQPAPDPA